MGRAPPTGRYAPAMRCRPRSSPAGTGSAQVATGRRPGLDSRSATADGRGRPSGDPGDAYQSPFGVGEVTDGKAGRRCGRTHDTCTPELFGALQGSLDIRDADVKNSVALVTRAASDAAADACPVFGGDQVQEPVTIRFRYLSRYRRGYVEFPAEELAEVLAEPSRAGSLPMISKCTTGCDIRRTSLAWRQALRLTHLVILP